MKKIEKKMIKEVNKALRDANESDIDETLSRLALSKNFRNRVLAVELIANNTKAQLQIPNEPLNTGKSPEECKAFNSIVRMYVNNGGISNYLSYDENVYVRSELAKYTFYKVILKRLIKDEGEIVRGTAYRNLFDTPRFITNIERDKLMKSAAKDSSSFVREAASSHVYDNIDYQLLFINDENPYVVASMLRHISICNDCILDVLVKYPNEVVRMEIVRFRRPKDLNILVKDGSENVRKCVATLQIPKYNDILIHDKSDFVRYTIAHTTHEYRYFKILMNDKSVDIRKIVAYRAPKAIVRLMMANEKNMVVRDAFSRRIEEEEKTKAAIKKIKKVE